MDPVINKRRAPVVTQILTVEETARALSVDAFGEVKMIYYRQPGKYQPFHVVYEHTDLAGVQSQIVPLMENSAPLMEALRGGFEVCFVNFDSFDDVYYRVVGDRCIRINVDSSSVCEDHWRPENQLDFYDSLADYDLNPGRNIDSVSPDNMDASSEQRPKRQRS